MSRHLPFNLLYVVCIEVYLLIWMIRYGLLLKNARDTFQDMYDKYHFDRLFSFFFAFFILCIAGRMRSYGMNMVLVGLQKMS